MRIGEVDVPSEVVQAIRDQQLVIFAGAGVSMDSPSDLPSFSELVDAIGHDSGQRPRIRAGTDGEGRHLSDEPLDHYLGFLAKQGVPVHQQAVRLLNRPTSKPNALHRLIASLYTEASKVQIVTTNFDRHLETAIEETHGELPRIYEAPALPVGSRFQGLVYLHGRLGANVDEMVLADQDFGRAYLTEGYARAFAKDLFENRIVLFIGYSHNDTIVSYLARGLPPSSGLQRHAFTPVGTQEAWEFLGIAPIEYELDEGGHSRLRDCLERLIETATAGESKQEERLRRIIEDSDRVTESVGRFSPPKAEDSDFLKWCLGARELHHLFFSQAKAPQWIEWMFDVGELDILFGRELVDSGYLRSLRYWLGADPLGDRGKIILQHLARDHQRKLDHPTRQAIARELWSDLPRPSEPIPKDGEAFISAWLQIILGEGDFSDHAGFLALILKDIDPSHGRIVRQLFDYLSRPHLLPEEVPRSVGREEQLRFSITHQGGRDHDTRRALARVWNEKLRYHLVDLAKILLPVVAANLESSYHLLRSVERTSRFLDRQSAYRFAVSPHEQNDRLGVVDTLVDAARDILEYLLEAEPILAHATIETWIRSEAGLLRRLAVHGLIRLQNLRPSRRIRYLWEHGLLEEPFAHFEVDNLIRSLYAELPKGSRTVLIRQKKAALERTARVRAKRPGHYEESKDQDFLRFLQELHRLDPQCPQVGEELAKRDQEPVEDSPIEVSAEEQSWLSEGGFVKVDSPYSADEVSALSPTELLARLQELSENRDSFFRSGIDHVLGLLEVVATVARDHLEWSVTLAETIEGSPFASRIWEQLFSGWNEAGHSEREWTRLCAALEGLGQQEARPGEFSYLLMERYTKAGRDFSSDDLGRAVQLALDLLPRLDETTAIIDYRNDWQLLAINHPIGWLSRFAVHVLSHYREQHGMGLGDLPALLRLLSHLTDEAPSGRYQGAVFLAGRLQYLLYVEPEWTREHVLPLFVHGARRLRSQVWDGFLSWGRITPEAITVLESGFSKLFEDLAILTKGSRRRLPRYVMLMCIRTPGELPELVPRFFASAQVGDRDLFWVNLSDSLSDLSKKEEEESWALIDTEARRWILPLIQRRIAMGLDFEGKEWAAIVGLGRYLGDALPDFVGAIVGSPPPRPSAPDFLWSLHERPQLWKHPESLADWLIFAFSGPPIEHLSLGDELRKTIQRLIKAEVSPDRIAELRNLYIRHGGRARDFERPYPDPPKVAVE